MGIRSGQLSFELQLLQNKVLLMMGNLSRNTTTRDLHMVFKIPYLHDFITKLLRQQATAIPTHENVNIHNIGQDKTQHKV
jgi:hypothetical protein